MPPVRLAPVCTCTVIVGWLSGNTSSAVVSYYWMLMQEHDTQCSLAFMCIQACAAWSCLQSESQEWPMPHTACTPSCSILCTTAKQETSRRACLHKCMFAWSQVCTNRSQVLMQAHLITIKAAEHDGQCSVAISLIACVDTRDGMSSSTFGSHHYQHFTDTTSLCTPLSTLHHCHSRSSGSVQHIVLHHQCCTD